MRRFNKILTVLFLQLILVLVKSSKCPESKRPHNTNCTMFYNCINLPIDGFIWVPSKCSDGLVFQPYLQMCVLPDKTWSCNNSENKSFISITNYENYTQSNLETLVSTHSYNANGSSDVVDKSTMDLYPSIEIQKMTISKQDNEFNNNVNNSLIINHKEENYLYEYIKKKSGTAFRLTNEDKDQLQSRYIWINQLINRLISYRELLRSLDQVALPSVDSLINVDAIRSNKISEQIANESNDIDTRNNIIMIIDEFGNRYYFTIEKYKSMNYKAKSSFVNIIPCIKDIRFPNKTDCTKYYTCEPLRAHVKEFTCPDNTAFNEYSRVCDTSKYKICKEQSTVSNKLSLINHTENSNSTSNNEIPKEKICQEIGKTVDPTSNIHYFICYSSTKKLGDIKAIRMKCPNNLKFCKSKKVCTTSQLCTV